MLRPLPLPPARAGGVATAPGRLGVLAAALTALAALLLVLAGTLTVPAQAARADGPEAPLRVTLSTLTPGYVPDSGPVHVTGTITNTDDEPWQAVQAYAFIGRTPMRTSAELAQAREVPETADVGPRIATPGLFDDVGTIAPGATATFSLDLPRRAIPVSEPGVYWFGVHALGTGPEGRVEGADGRARTFLPLVDDGQAEGTPAGRGGRAGRRATPPARVDTALVVPLRHGVSYAPDGSVADSRTWTRQLRTGGRLRALLDFGAAAGSRPISWLVDPGLTDTVRALALGNPPRTLLPGSGTGPDTGTGGQGSSTGGSGSGGSASPSASGTPADGATAGGAPDDQGAGQGDDRTVDPGTADLVDAARSWLDRLDDVVGGSRTLTVPYGDVDVSAAAARSPSLLQRARQRSRSGIGVPGGTSPAVAPPGGYLDPAALGALGKRTTVLVRDDAVAPALDGGSDGSDDTSSQGTEVPTVVRARGHELLVTAGDVAAGGPGPEDPLGTLAVRQRILAEASVRLLSSSDPQPMVVELPSRWAPTAAEEFFAGLDVDWLRLTDVQDVARRRATPVAAGDLAYPEEQARQELDAENFSSAQSLIRAGGTLQRVLTANDTVAATVADQALHTLGYAHRHVPRITRASTDRSRAWIEQQLGSIRIDAPAGVTLSSSSGRFAATLRNGLDEAVTVSIKAITDEPHAVTGPSEVEIGPGGVATVLLKASADRPGVHNVTLVVTDSEGIPLGSSDRLPIRSAQVSKVIWLILGTGVALLFGAIAVRLVRRVRAARATARTPGGGADGPDDGPADGPTDGPNDGPATGTSTGPSPRTEEQV